MSDEVEEFDTSYTEELVCPYCGYEHSDSWEIGDSENSSTCNNCDKNFKFDQQISRTFSTYPTCQPGDEHKFNEWQHYLGKRWTRYCTICSAREWKEVSGEAK